MNLKLIMPAAKQENIDKYFPVFEKYKDEYKVNTPLRQAAFWAHVAHESQQLNKVEESLYYKTPESLMRTWPSRFKTVPFTMPFVKNPVRIANYVYGGRMGNKKPNDGWDHRGAGLIQLTGYDNHLVYSKSTYNDDRIARHPELLQEPEDAVRSALWFWNTRPLNKAADEKDIERQTKLINGGLNGLADRKYHYELALKAYGVW